jgi:hypothetical protein
MVVGEALEPDDSHTGNDRGGNDRGRHRAHAIRLGQANQGYASLRAPRLTSRSEDDAGKRDARVRRKAPTRSTTIRLRRRDTTANDRV